MTPIDKARALLEYKEMLGNKGTWADVEEMVGISESRRKQFVSLLKLPEKIQQKIVSIGKRPSKNQITEKHARALLILNKFPEEQGVLFEQITDNTKTMNGDETIQKAKELKGIPGRKTFKIVYTSKEDLIRKIEKILHELKSAL